MFPCLKTAGIAATVALSSLLAAVAAPATNATSAPTYSKDVAPILFKNCATCHRPGEIAPMSLLTYQQTRPWAKAIKSAVTTGKMPPWHAEEPRGTFSNDRRLTDDEKDTLLRWVAAGAPEGNPSDMPAVPQFAEGWEIGKPDVVLSMEKPFDVPASGTIDYQYFRIPTNFTEDKWVKAIEVRPGVNSVVHHILVFAREPGKAPIPPVTAFHPVIPPGSPRGGFGTPGALIATTAPGTNAMTFAPGTALLIKAGSVLMFQVHYTANGKPTQDLSKVGFIFDKEPAPKEIYTSAFVNATLDLPPGDSNKEVDSAIQFDQDTHVYALFPHTHLRGKSWEYQLTYPDGRTEVILSVPKYDFNWQTYYTFTKPLAIPKGSKILAIAHYDNSVNNASNPDPKKEVRWGEQTWQEMQYSGITYTVDAPNTAAVLVQGEK